MKNWRKMLEALAVAVTFSEAGEWQAAQNVLEEADRRSHRTEVERKQGPRPRAREQSYRL
jgi:hypothetical protein